MRQSVVVLYKDIDDILSEEVIAASALPDGSYKVDSMPYYAPNIAIDDIFSARADGDTLYFEEMLDASGHSTLQVFFFDMDQADSVVGEWSRLGCSFQGKDEEPFGSLDIPPSVLYDDVISYIKTQVANEVLDYREACLSNAHKV